MKILFVVGVAALFLLTGCVEVSLDEVEIPEGCSFMIGYDNRTGMPNKLDILSDCTVKLKDGDKEEVLPVR